MTREDSIRKLTSRKFWGAVVAFIAGLIVAFGEAAETAETVTGLIMSGATVLGYLLAEGLTDAAAAGGGGTHEEPVADEHEEENTEKFTV
ncbi:MAG: hypothetical protein SPE18_07410 [Candidatus Limivicinus sp.]|nr:hypothetical protein [Candidatus Limivicinus sp.]